MLVVQLEKEVMEYMADRIGEELEPEKFDIDLVNAILKV